MTTPVSEQYALTVPAPTSLPPVAPLAAPAPTPRTGLPALFNADTMSHAGITAVSLGGLSFFAYAGGLTTSLIAVAALATGALASRFLGNRVSLHRQLGTALADEVVAARKPLRGWTSPVTTSPFPRDYSCSPSNSLSAALEEHPKTATTAESQSADLSADEVVAARSPLRRWTSPVTTSPFPSHS